MHQTSIFFPMAALVGWTMTVFLLIPFQRAKAVMSKKVKMEDFKFGESENVPPETSIPNRNVMNLLEIPVLFYVACLTVYAAKLVDPTFVWMAWGYLGIRICHSLVHLTYNKVPHRLALFAMSNVLLLVFWIRLALSLPR